MDSAPALDRATEADLPAVVELFNRELGDPLYSYAGLRADLRDPEVAVFVARVDAIVAGAALGRLLIPEDAGYYARFGELAARAFAAGTVGSLEALAVRPAARRRGLGRALVSAVERWLFDSGSAAVAVVGWDSGRSDSSLPLLRGLGYAESPRVERFYEAESRRDGWRCPVCGGVCVCAAVLFVRDRPG